MKACKTCFKHKMYGLLTTIGCIFLSQVLASCVRPYMQSTEEKSGQSKRYRNHNLTMNMIKGLQTYIIKLYTLAFLC